MENRTALTVEIFDPEGKAAQNAQKALVLREIYLVDAKTWREPFISPTENLTLEHKCATELTAPPENEFSGEELNEDLDFDFFLCKFRLTGFNDKSPNKPILKIEATFLAVFSQDMEYYYPPFDLNEAIGVEQQNGEKPFDELYSKDFHTYFWRVIPLTTAWPYWREFAQNMSARMGFPALTLPLLEIVPKKPEEDASDHEVKKVSRRSKKKVA